MQAIELVSIVADRSRLSQAGMRKLQSLSSRCLGQIRGPISSGRHATMVGCSSLTSREQIQ